MSPPHGFKSLPLPIAQLSLAAVLKCGQSFRWTTYPLKAAAPLEMENIKTNGQPTHEYRLVLRDRVVCLRQDVDTLFYRALFPESAASVPEDEVQVRDKQTLAWLRDYFQLDTDLVKLYSEWSEKDSVFRETVKDRFPGIRMLRQDPWENVVSFICSSNNHIGRITKMVQSLCTAFSDELCSLSTPHDGEETSTTVSYHPFPTPKQLADDGVAAKLRELGFGYRAEYVQRTAQILCEEHEDPEAYLKSLRDLPVEEARTELLKLCGVGPKVADCVLLMSLDKKAVVPVDTHVHQIALKYYGLRGTPQGKGGKVPMTPKIYEAVGTKLTQTWGEYAGWAHSVLFTADLRSFANYGLETPNASPIKSPATSVPPTPSEADSDYFGASPIKRRRSETKTRPQAKRVKTK
ncbi:8-oxoguanine glycosylase ogg1 [Serendipita sp. 396]|nr:8-oxoguanine glycosylase ogg1 [Serendipita sp. 396]KAG8787190.1 8-oxoguanine glycosylase ogg1 [Serendipita sp. 397]KAG8802530.1 8-oxoguanine glycosylase ogg1 [Serendipita sp. 398]KAG8875761.1 8-oxoguanine glycosylase ogg1 [Serendipita sp. 405]